MLVAAKGTKGLYYSFRGKEMRCSWSGVQFRRWATEHLSEYLVKCFTMDDERLNNPDGRPDYSAELLLRIRDIRASEKRFYQKTHAGRKTFIDITESAKKDAIKKMEEAFKKK